jgi:hypothetical protein
MIFRYQDLDTLPLLHLLQMKKVLRYLCGISQRVWGYNMESPLFRGGIVPSVHAKNVYLHYQLHFRDGTSIVT